jgi:hypothetical protein
MLRILCILPHTTTLCQLCRERFCFLCGSSVVLATDDATWSDFGGNTGIASTNSQAARLCLGESVHDYQTRCLFRDQFGESKARTDPRMRTFCGETRNAGNRYRRNTSSVVVEISPSRARTCDLAVNSRSLYLLSYRGIAPLRHQDALGSGAIIGDSLPDFNKFIKISTEWLVKHHGDSGQPRNCRVFYPAYAFSRNGLRCEAALLHPESNRSEFRVSLQEHGDRIAHLCTIAVMTFSFSS